MKFKSLSKQSMTRDNLRVVNIRRTLYIGLSAATALTVVAFGMGIWAGRAMSTTPEATIKVVQDPAKEKFAITKLGELSGRLMRLETDAAYLVKKVGDHEEIARKLATINPQLVPDTEQPAATQKTNAKQNGKGGILLPARTCDNLTQHPQLHNTELTATHIEQAESSINCLQQLFTQMESAVAARNADFMAIPSLRPVNTTRIGSSFGNRLDPFTSHLAFHSGLDFPSPSGTPIYAAAGGRVISAGWHGGYGNQIEIDHGNGLVTRYAHTSKMYVKEGEVIMPHQLIAAMGSTGRSTGSHLHFEVMYHGEFVDPKNFLSLSNMEVVTDDQAAD